MLSQIILQILLILFNMIVTLSRVSTVSVNDSDIEKLALKGDKRAEKVNRFNENHSDFVASLRTASEFASFIGSAFSGVYFSDGLTVIIMQTGLSESVSRNIAIVLITLAFAYITLVLGKFVPEKIAKKNPEKLALRLSGITNIIKKIFFPITWLVKVSSKGILLLIGIDSDKDDNSVTEEEIIMMSDAGAENGTIDEDENQIIKNVFAFDDMTVGQICTHRTDVSVLWNGESVDNWEETIHLTRHSEFPICGESVDNVIGILNAKDYFRLIDKTMDNIMKNAVHEPYFVHENLKADRLFAQMKKNGNHFAVVVDEYGGMSGIVTITDLVEQLVGEFDDDELDEPEILFEKTGDNTWLIPGTTSIAEVCEELEITLPSEKYDTFGGYVIDKLGAIPKDGEQTVIDSDGLHIETLRLHHHRIELCRVKKIIDENI